jgi:hypothetical protein
VNLQIVSDLEFSTMPEERAIELPARTAAACPGICTAEFWRRARPSNGRDSACVAYSATAWSTEFRHDL